MEKYEGYCIECCGAGGNAVDDVLCGDNAL